MNRDQRRTYWYQWERRRANLEKKHRGKIYKALKGQVHEYTRDIREKGLHAAYLNLDLRLPYENLSRVLEVLYIKGALYQANLTYGETRKVKFVGFGFNEEWTNLIIQYFRQYILNKAVLPITENTREVIRKILNVAITEGWSIDETVKEIEKKGTEVNRKRARVIVRTESVRAMNYGAMVGAEKSRLVMEKVWITAKDERVRGSHRRLEGKRADMDEIFEGSSLKFPGDPDAPAKEVVNCRCTIAMMPKRDENGKLIRKPVSIETLINENVL
jgi:SPP1 gp7 family putative phage head morphogenesis protein